MRFEERDLKPYGEPVSPDALKEGETCFAVQFMDERALIPVMEPFVFAGRNLEGGEGDNLHFQDVESYRAGVGYSTAGKGREAQFQIGAPNTFKHMFEYERALDVLMYCALRRRKALDQR